MRGRDPLRGRVYRLHRDAIVPQHCGPTNGSPEHLVHRIARSALTLGLAWLLSCICAGAFAAEKPHLYQSPALSRDLIAFGYAGDL